jgi:hypothetical protein
METQPQKYVIESVTLEGKRFRPSDWIDRISSLAATFGPSHRLVYSEDLHPETIKGERCLVLDVHLQQDNPWLFEHVMSFAEKNQLRMVKVKSLEELLSSAG